jgi:hypothetical protein
MLMKSVVFWVITRRRVVIITRRRVITQKTTDFKGMQAQHANLGIALPLLEWLKYKNSKMPKFDKQKITMFWY